MTTTAEIPFIQDYTCKGHIVPAAQMLKLIVLCSNLFPANKCFSSAYHNGCAQSNASEERSACLTSRAKTVWFTGDMLQFSWSTFLNQNWLAAGDVSERFGSAELTLYLP